MIDLRSDTVTKPTPVMREAMYRAEVGDDVFGEDPTVKLLEQESAQLLGKEAALFCASGTMANQVAIKCWVNPGEEVLLEAESHIMNYELGAFAVISGAVPRAIAAERGILRAAQMKPFLRPPAYYLTRPGLLTVENTHNMSGGVVYPIDILRELWTFAQESALPLHLDGARIFNAAVSLGVAAREIAANSDSVMFSLSKGLAAPVGSILAGPAGFIQNARRARKMLGGGMRQAGIVAAAGLVGIRSMIDRLREDHQKAWQIGQAISRNEKFAIDLERVQTNIVRFEVRSGYTSAQALVDALRQQGILTAATDVSQIRVVTHLDVSWPDVDDVCEALERT